MAEKAKILIVDDEKGTRDLLSFMLRTEGYRAVEASSSKGALECIAEQTFDVVIADITMPDVNGLELLRHIREYDSDTVIIVMTAYASLQTAVKAMRFGAYDYLLKPFNDVEKVINIVARAVERCRLARRNARLLRNLQAANRRLEELFAESQEHAAELEAAYNELKERELFKSLLVSNVSHQLRSPLALVKGYVTLMADCFLGDVTGEQAMAMERVNERLDNLVQVIDDLVFMQDIESGNAYLCLETLSLTDLVQRVCHRMQPRARRKHIALQMTIQGNEDKEIPVIQGDPLRMEQALTRLLDSVIKFGASHSRISVEVGAKNQNLYLSIHNQGQDVLPDKVTHASEGFHQINYDTQRPVDALEQGLLLVNHIVEMHGGEVTFTSDEVAGVAVWLILPLEDKGRLLHQSMALNNDLADRFRMAVGFFPYSKLAGERLDLFPVPLYNDNSGEQTVKQ